MERKELLRHFFGHWGTIPYLILAPACLALGLAQAQIDAIVWFLIGWVFFLVQEYVTHILVFHGWVPKKPNLYALMYRLHLGHHHDPERLDLLFTPLWYTAPMFFANAIIFYLFTKELSSSMMMTSGLTFGYLQFEWFHLLVHSPVRVGPVLSFVRKRHNGHHYWNERKWLTVSPLGIVLDFVFGTSGDVSKAARSADPVLSGVKEDESRLIEACRRYPPT